ncbi:hypothetical protein GQ53DRAFT_644570 [Thozetella sp. PMI_491]|nr:hypothetical protein GQ53DRAFT_644570 [Thozetella sp. PMI_491]
MRLSARRRGARSRQSSPFSFLKLSSLLTLTSFGTAGAVTFTPAPAADLDLSQLGRVAVVGDFSGISLFEFAEQAQNSLSTNGSDSLLARMPNGAFASLVQTDASIQAMCTFTLKNGSMAGVVIGGNFTSLAGKESTAIAMFNPNTSAITPLSGISGQVSALLCDQEQDTVYVGGNFVGANSTNAIAWVGTQGWTNLPFAGFNGPVTSITKASNGHIIFGGSFTGLGNASLPSTPDGQVINLSSANLTSGNSATTAGFSDPKNIVCSDGSDAAGKTWLLQDNTPGFWQATFGFGFQPTKLRLHNTHQDGRGTKTFRFTALPLNGIMNFTYIDPATGANSSCTSECPLSSDTSVKFQDFHFVNAVGMNAFRIDISAFYGSGGGLNGIELFENDIFAHAINDFNEPTCAGLAAASTATATGPWKVTTSGASSSEYLTAELSSPISSSSASIVFSPDIRESGHYSVNVFTPGCLQDNSCDTRGQFIISGQMTADLTKGQLNQTLFQTNNFDKYDQIYFGQIDASTTGFRPKVTMTPANGQSLTSMTFVAQRVGFTLINSTGGLNGLFEYDPTSATVNVSDFTSSAFDKLGAGFATGSAVNTLQTAGDVTYIGGNFTSPQARNIVAMNGNSAEVQALDGGLNGEVLSMVLNGTNLFVGGRFSGTQDGKVSGLSNVAVYDTSKNTWSALGAGVNGRVRNVVLLTMNVTSTTPEVVVSVNGDFTQLEAFGTNAAVSVQNFGVWIPSQNNWLQNLNLAVESLEGMLSTSIIDPTGANTLYAGSIVSSSLGVRGAALVSTALARFPARIEPAAAAASASGAVDGVTTGVFDLNNGRNITILGGHFTANATNGGSVNNLLFIDGANTVTGLGTELVANSTFVALAVQGDSLFAGGNVTGTVNGAKVTGLVSYNLATGQYNAQPPALSGAAGTVSAIAVRPSTQDVYVGGSFQSAGSLGCPAVCFFSTATRQWNQPGVNFDGTTNAMMWTSDTQLVAGGAFTVNNSVPAFLVTYDATKQTWDRFPGAAQLPGPVTQLTAASSDATQLWVTGTANGSVFLTKYDGTKWTDAPVQFGAGTAVRGLQIFTVSPGHDSSDTVAGNEILMLTGAINIPGSGFASAAIFNGTTLRPYLVTAGSGASTGSIAHIFSENNSFFSSSTNQLPLVFVILIGLGISLALMLLIVVAGLFLDRLRKKREGYIPAPTSMYDRGSGIQRIRPEDLLGGLGKPRPGAPQV